jgi:hypothetical protein
MIERTTTAARVAERLADRDTRLYHLRQGFRARRLFIDHLAMAEAQRVVLTRPARNRGSRLWATHVLAQFVTRFQIVIVPKASARC